MPTRPKAPDRRNSLASLSVAQNPNDAYDDEPTWPSGWRPYTCLLGGFFLMFNSWGLVRDDHVDAMLIRLLMIARSTHTVLTPATTCSISCRGAKCE